MQKNWIVIVIIIINIIITFWMICLTEILAANPEIPGSIPGAARFSE
jgi:hypothetical protein